METIQSTSNKTIKALAKLHQKKYRDQENRYLIEGEHLVNEAKNAGVLEHIYSLSPYPIGIPNTLCSQPVLNKLSSQQSDAVLIGVCRKNATESAASDHILVLNDVQDPGNLGTLLRSAYSFGFEKVILSPGCADLYNSKTIQSSQGALFHIPVEKQDILSWIGQARSEGFVCFATALHSHSRFLHEISFPKKTALILGNEGSGLPDEIIKACNESVKIEMAAFESLNVAIAGSIGMYEAFIQSSRTD